MMPVCSWDAAAGDVAARTESYYYYGKTADKNG